MPAYRNCTDPRVYAVMRAELVAVPLVGREDDLSDDDDECSMAPLSTVVVAPSVPRPLSARHGVSSSSCIAAVRRRPLLVVAVAALTACAGVARAAAAGEAVAMPGVRAALSIPAINHQPQQTHRTSRGTGRYRFVYTDLCFLVPPLLLLAYFVSLATRDSDQATPLHAVSASQSKRLVAQQV